MALDQSCSGEEVRDQHTTLKMFYQTVGWCCSG